METKIFQKDEIKMAADALRQNELVAFPTETVYGLGANATSEQAVKKVFAVKGRPTDNPLIVHVQNFEQVKNYVAQFHPLTPQIVERFWPGPLTLIFKTKPNAFPSVVSAGLSTVSFRMPNHPLTLALIEATGVPLVGPSANTSGRPSPTTSQHVYHDLQGKIAGILEGGATEIGVESTVLDLSDSHRAPMILRPGGVTKEELETVLGMEVLVDPHLVSESEVPKSPGMKYQHYAPSTKVLMIGPTDWEEALNWAQKQQLKVGLQASPEVVRRFQSQAQASYCYADNQVASATKGLFAGLRALDEADLDYIFVATYPETGLGTAYMNRLKKAANQKYFMNN